MICANCEMKNGKPYVIINSVGTETVVYLCDACASKYGFIAAPRKTENTFSGVCRRCGTKLVDIEKTGYVGCAYCYTEFKDKLYFAINRFQNNALSNGNKKMQKQQYLNLKSEYEKLLNKQEYALKTGDIALARVLDGKLAELSNRLKSLL